MGGVDSGLTPAARSVWAKSAREVDGEWLPLWRHLADTAGAAAWLWENWLPTSVRRCIASSLPSDEDGRLLLVWLAAAHDIGKISPVFAIQHRPGAERMAEHGLEISRRASVLEDRASFRHETASYHALQHWLVDKGWRKREARAPALVVGSHHGRSPSAELAGRQPASHLFGTGVWHDVRREYLDWVCAHAGVQDRLEAWRSRQIDLRAQVLLTGCVIVADWIASDDQRFDYGECIHADGRVEAAMRGLHLPAPWHPELRPPGELFAARFGSTVGSSPRAIQIAAPEIAAAVDAPGLLLIEAPMGEGKTEAALLAAETFAARAGAGGLLTLLPTRATSSAMFARVLAWLESARSIDSGPTSVVLAHAKAGLDERYRGLPRIGRGVPGQTDVPPTDLIAVHQWLGGRKKALFANVAVGTVDQLLFAALKSKHLMLRHLAVAGKVVVIDEVHSYDAYMSVYLERAVEWLGAYEVPVVLLSATLPAARRAALVRAYEAGRGVGADPARQVDADKLGMAVGYPLLVATTTAAPQLRVVPASRPPRSVRLEALVESDDGTELAELLSERLADGGRAVVIRNSVRRVQDTARMLRQSLPADTQIIVTHARYVDAHRAIKDRRLIELFGPAGTADPATPYVVVASQVVEQSLDVDFDLMVSDVAPVDLLLQRIGRLHRHDRERPARLRDAVCFVTGVEDWSAEPPTVVRGFRRVYSEYVQLRTLAALAAHLQGLPLSIPVDIPDLVQAVYGDATIEPLGWSDAVADARARHDGERRRRERAAQAFRLDSPDRSDLRGWLDGDAGEADESARTGRPQVRDTGLSLEVLVVRRDDAGRLRALAAIGEYGGELLPTERPLGYSRSRALAACAVSLTEAVLGYGPARIDRAIASLERNFVAAWQEDLLLAGELLLVLDESGRAEILPDLVVAYGVDGIEAITPLPDVIM